jgi:type I restriction enzyme, S subunit
MTSDEFPEAWERSSLGDLIEIVMGQAPPGTECNKDGDGAIFVKAGEFGEIKPVVREWTTKPLRMAREGDVLLCVVGATCGKLNLAIDCAIGRSVAALRPLSNLDQKYLYYFLVTRVLHLRQGSTGSAQGVISKDDIFAVEIPIYPVNEQRRIVAKIEELLSELDNGVEALTTARQQLTAYRQSVLKHAFEGGFTTGLRETQPVWRCVHLGDEIDFLTSGSRGWADYYADSGDTFIRAQNLKHDRLDLTDIAFVKLPEGNTEGLRTRVKVGDVLITITGANVTKTGIVTSDIGTAYVSQHVALCRLRPSILPSFLYWHLLSETHGRRQLTKAAYGAGKPGLNLDNIRSVTLSLPSPQEQAIVVERIEAALSIEQELSEGLEDELRRTCTLRQSILKQAFSGQLAQNPKDEPASALLEQICTERESSATKKKQRNSKNVKRERPHEYV